MTGSAAEGMVRASNTQPVLVERFGAANAELLGQYKEEVEGVVAEAKKAVGAVQLRGPGAA